MSQKLNGCKLLILHCEVEFLESIVGFDQRWCSVPGAGGERDPWSGKTWLLAHLMGKD